ncbi:MAG: ferrous iron transport protein A [bacterium]|nr:ferrous iron transport protein A [bacterium]
MTLNDLEVGSSAVITEVGGEGNLRLRLLDMGLIPKTAVRVVRIAPLGDPIEIELRGYSLTLRRNDAKNIVVSRSEVLI